MFVLNDPITQSNGEIKVWLNDWWMTRKAMGGEKINKRFYLPVFFKLVLLIWVSFKHGHFIDGKNAWITAKQANALLTFSTQLFWVQINPECLMWVSKHCRGCYSVESCYLKDQQPAVYTLYSFAWINWWSKAPLLSQWEKSTGDNLKNGKELVYICNWQKDWGESSFHHTILKIFLEFLFAVHTSIGHYCVAPISW